MPVQKGTHGGTAMHPAAISENGQRPASQLAPQTLQEVDDVIAMHVGIVGQQVAMRRGSLGQKLFQATEVLIAQAGWSVRKSETRELNMGVTREPKGWTRRWGPG